MNCLPPKLQSILDDLAFFTDRAEKIQALISVGQRYTPPAADVVTKPYDESHRVPGCESEVFVWARPAGSGWQFDFVVENPQGLSAMALAVILQEGLEGESAQAIQTVPDDLVYRLFGNELSMGKSMGLIHMVQMCRHLVASS